MKRNFDQWLSTFRPSINSYKYYVDFEKVKENADKVKVELNMLNALVAEKNIEQAFENIVAKYPTVIQCLPILLAVRKNQIYCQDENGAVNYTFDPNKPMTVKQYKYFLRETGLFKMLQTSDIKNLYDYCIGVEVGLDSNARKNRGGHQMEDLLERYIKNTGVQYFKEMKLSEIEKKWNVDLSAISAEGKTEKRWDFVVKTPKQIYVFETNFYTGGGSKLNETARSYKMIAEESKQCKGVTFVWVTDGKGWGSARNNLNETFNVMDNLYNITDLENGVLDKLVNKQ